MSITLLADAAIKGLIYVGFLFAIVVTLRRGPAAVRHLFWSVGLVGLIALPLLSVVVPLRIALPDTGSAANEAVNYEDAVPQPIVDSDSQPLDKSEKDAGRVLAAPREGAISGEAGGERSAPAISALANIKAPRLAGLIAMVWIAGVLVIVGRLVLGMIAMSIVARRGVRLEGRDWSRQLSEARSRLGIGVPVRLVLTQRASVPFGIGILNPTIVFPSEAEDWSEERRMAVLLHELAHVSRRDMVAHLMSQLACALHWFNPLVWLGARRLRAESERACDDLVLRAGTTPSEYAGHLIDIVRTAGRSWTPAAALPMARRSEFEGRLLAILEPGVKRHGPTPTAVVFVVLAVALTSVPLAAMGPERQTAGGSEAVQPVSEPTASADAVIALIGALEDDDIEVRRTVAASLGALQDTTAVEALMRALRIDSDPEVRQAAAYALGEIEDPRAIPALGEALLRDDEPAVRVMAAHALGEIDDAQGVEPLSAVINDPDYEVRLAAIRALAEIESPRAIDALSSVLGDSEAEIRELAVRALGEIEDARAVPPIANVLTSDSEASVRLMAAWALGEIEHASAIDALAAALSDQDVEVRRMAVWALGEIEDPRAVDPLVGLLQDDDVEMRQRAVRALGEIESRRSVDPLVGALRDSDARVRVLAAWALGEIQDARAVPGLSGALSDADVSVRRAAAQALGEIDQGTAPPALIQALSDEDLTVRRYAVRALGEIEDPSAVPGLTDLFRSSGDDVETRRYIIWALGEIEDPAAYQVLVSALEDDDPEIRKAAARALGGNDSW
jgi:HEAT repeat protein/beta-lactamase regulating signal transducer with metallopeptidase domain